jgi:hypothetical protein
MSGESIYSWIKAAPVVPEKEPLHRSAHAPLSAPSATTFRGASIKKATGSMGRSVKHTVRPDEFCKSGAEANKKWKETLRESHPNHLYCRACFALSVNFKWCCHLCVWVCMYLTLRTIPLANTRISSLVFSTALYAGSSTHEGTRAAPFRPPQAWLVERQGFCRAQRRRSYPCCATSAWKGCR